MASDEVYATKVLMNVGLRTSRYTAVVVCRLNGVEDRLDIGIPVAWCGHSHRKHDQAEACAGGLVARYERELQQLDELRAAREKREREVAGVA